MRKLLLLFAMTGAAMAQSATTTTYTGVLTDLSQQVITSGQVTFSLTPSTDSTLPGTGRFIPSTINCNINIDGTLSGFISGAVSGPCVVTRNTAITPGGTAYRVCIQAYFQTPGSCWFDYATTATKDISTPVPTLSTGPTNYGGVPGPPIPFLGTWSSSMVYTLGQAVSYNNSVYISLINPNQGNTPSSSPADWSVVLSPASLIASPSTTQNVVQPSGTTMTVNNLNFTPVINGDGTTDNTASIQEAVNTCAAGATCAIQLNNVVIAGSVNLPATSNYEFTGTLGVKCTGPGMNCFERDLTTGTALFRVRFHGMKFIKANAGAVIADLMVFSSAGNQGMTIDHNFFTLTGSATGWLTQGSTQNIVVSNSFTSFTDPAHTGGSADRSGVAIASQGSAGSFGSQVTMVADNIFNYMTGIKPNIVTGANDAWEGWAIHNNQFVVSLASVGSGDEINFTGNSFVDSNFTITGNLFNSSILANYFDSQVMGSTMILVAPALGQVAALQIQDNHFELGSGPNLTGIKFQNSSNGVTGVTVTGNNYSGVSPSTATTFSITSNILTVNAPNGFIAGEEVVLSGFTVGTYLNDQGMSVLSASSSQFTAAFTHANVASTGDAGTVFPVSYGVWFADSNLRNLYLGAENFRLTWAALQFTQILDRSTISSFEARDVYYYANGLAANRGTYLISDHLYVTEPVRVSGYLPTSGSTINFADTWVPNPSMFPGFVGSVAIGTCDPNVTSNIGVTGLGAYFLFLQSTPSTVVGLHICDATVTFDGTKYVAPR